MSDFVNIDRPDFNSMNVEKLRQYASFLQVTLNKSATKDEIIEAIDRKLKGRASASIAGDDKALKPGHARITMLNDPTPGASNYPVYVNANGYECTIPRGVTVDVPMRVVRTLQDASVKRKRQTGRVDAQGREFTEDVETLVPSYPFQIHAIEPGPEALTPFEQSKARSNAPRKKYKQKFGYYPKPGQLARAVENGWIKLEGEEELPASEESFLIAEAEKKE